MDYILQIKDLCKSYNKHKVLNNLNMNVPNGSIYGFVGKNGTGKTTTIRLACGLQKPNSGSVNFSFNDKRKIGAIVENPALNMDMTAYENMQIQFDLINRKDYESINDILKTVGLQDVGKKKAKVFSLGMKQRLGIAMTLCCEPEILFLDEPINGLDPQGIIDMRNTLLAINKEKGITIVISSHILEELSKIATHYGFISNGQIISELSSEDLNRAVQHRVDLHVDNTENAEVALQNMSNEFIIGDKIITVIGDIVLTDIVLQLHKHNITVYKAIERDETLEEFFLKTIGGEQNAQFV